MVKKNAVRRGKPVTPSDGVASDHAVERVPGEAKIGCGRDQRSDPAVVKTEPAVVLQPGIPIGLGDAHLAGLHKESNLEDADGGHQQRLTRSQQAPDSTIS